MAYSGDISDPTRVEHICTFPGCCTCREDAVAKLDAVAKDEPIPKIWALSRWLGWQEALDFCGFGMANGAIFLAGVLIGWMGMNDMDEVEVLMVRCLQGLVAKHNFDSQASDFANCIKEMTDIERQTTYKKNIHLWIQSQPLPRLWILKSFNSVQQEHQKKILRTSGEL